MRHHSINQDKTNYAHAVWCKELICYGLRQCHELIDWDCRFSTDNERSTQMLFLLKGLKLLIMCVMIRLRLWIFKQELLDAFNEK